MKIKNIISGIIILLFFLLFPCSYLHSQELPQPLTGTFLSLKNIEQAQLPNILNEITSLGLDTIIVDKTRNPVSGCDSSYQWDPQTLQKIHTLLEEAQRRNIQVYLGLSLSQCGDFTTETHRQQDAQDMKSAVQTILEQESTNPSLAGWYIPLEPSLAYIDNSEQLNQTYQYFKTIVDALHTVSNKPIIVSPILAGAQNKSPAVIAQRALDLKTISGVDIQAWQDSEGTYATPLDWVRDSATTYQLRDYVNAISQAIGKHSFWSNVELFTCPLTFSFADIGDCASSNWSLYKPASAIRIYNQIQHSANAGKIVSWLTHIMMSQVDPIRKPEADRLYASFQALNNKQYTYLVPANYQWITQPQPQYADSGNELFDKKTGDPRNMFNQNWVGVLGDAELIIDLGAKKRVDWLGVHTLNKTTAGISFPDTLSAHCSSDNATWSPLGGVWRLQVPESDADYVFANQTAFQADCRYIKVALSNTTWTFFSEMEIVGKSTQIVLGDANGDGRVTGSDYIVWLTHYRQYIQGAQNGDFDGNGFVDGRDYTMWLLHYGR